MKTILLMAIMMLAAVSHAEDMQKYLHDTREMVKQKKYEEALNRCIWFHEHALEHDPGMYGVRLSFALSDWKELGDVYPPAKTALIETRDRKTKLIEEDKGSFYFFADVVALNRILGEAQKTVALFELVDRTQPESAKEYWNVAEDAVISAKRYDLVRKYIGNPVREFLEVKARYDEEKASYDDPRMGGEHFKAWNEDHFVEESVKLIGVALALDDKKAAQEIQQQALAILDDYRLRDAIPKEQAETAPPSTEGGGQKTTP